MERSYRFNFSGLIFFLIIFCYIFFSNKGFEWIGNANNDGYTLILSTIIGIFTAIYASESFGYIFNSFFLVWWQWVYPTIWYGWKGIEHQGGGHSFEQYRFAHSHGLDSIKDKVIKLAETEGYDIPQHVKRYPVDIFFSFFWKDSPEKLFNAAQRRADGFFVAMTEIIAVIAAWIVCIIIYLQLRIHPFPVVLTSLLFVSLIFTVICYCNAKYSKDELLQIQDFWIRYGIDNKEMKNFFDRIKNKQL